MQAVPTQVHIVGTRLISNRTAKWIGAAAVGDRIYFAPYAARRVLVCGSDGISLSFIPQNRELMNF